jgi:hypothetical protein
VKTIDITTEAFRIYHYDGGKTFRIDAPKAVHVIEDERGISHRVEAEDGQTYRPERGWIGISWEPKPGAPPFVA